MTPKRCNRPGCTGSLMVTGYCDRCLMKPLAGTAVPDVPPAAPPADRVPESGSGEDPLRLDRDGLVVLPDVPAPARAVTTVARPPSGGRRCGVHNCMGTIGIGYGDRPAPPHGYCPVCGEWYSFEPRLHPGDLVGEHYRVLGYLARGGIGWVHLAEDVRVPGHQVVLKGLINPRDDAARRNAEEERRRLTTLHHRDIVGIITFEEHQAEGEAEPAGYTVMEYVPGRSLQDLLNADDDELHALFGGPFAIDHVLTYGCKILGALEYLHREGWLYCDLKPDNVIHYGRDIKIIDLGAVRRIGDRDTPLVFHPDFAPPRRERETRGFTVDTDLYTVGRTLRVLAARATPATGLAARSFERLITRATHPEPAARFASAAEMSHQIWLVLREHRALFRGEESREQPTRFDPTSETFGAALGTVPGLDHWAGRAAAGRPDMAPGLDIAPPAAADVARALPVPLPDTRDAATAELSKLAADRPEEVAKRFGERTVPGTAEAAFWLCRAFLRTGDTDGAEHWLREAAGLGADGTAALYDWRLSWHRGVLELTRGHIDEASQEFGATFGLLPGEWAPKLALGYCCECLHVQALARASRRELGGRPAEPGAPADPHGQAGEPDLGAQAEAYYTAVLRRDPTQGSAAFGLLRAHLRAGERDKAVAVLDGIPRASRHHTTARTAAVRVLAGRLAGRPPTAEGLADAADRLERLALGGREPRDRLVTVLREAAAACRPPGGWEPGLPSGDLFGTADTPRDLDRLLHESLRGLAGQATDRDERGDLLDLAYTVRPETRF